MQTIADRIRLSIERTGRMQRDLARAAGMNPQQFSNYANGHQNPSKKNIERLAAALDVDPFWLATGVNRQALKNIDVPRPATIYKLDELPGRGGRAMDELFGVEDDDGCIYVIDPTASVTDGCVALAEWDDGRRLLARVALPGGRDVILSPLDNSQSLKIKRGECYLSRARWEWREI